VASKPGRGLLIQPADRPVVARHINQYRRPAEAFERMGVGAGMTQQDTAGGAPNFRVSVQEVLAARITAAPVNGGHPWKAVRFKIDTVANTRTWVDLPTDQPDLTSNNKDPIYEWSDGALPVGLILTLRREEHSGALIYDGEGLWWQAKSPATSVAAKSGNIPTPFQAALFTWDGTNEIMPATPQMVQSRNNYPSAIAANKVIWMVMRRGKWFTPVEACV
jgi:hypothetical protein